MRFNTRNDMPFIAEHGDDHDVGFGMALRCFADDLDAANIGKPEVDHQHIRGVKGQGFPRRLAVPQRGKQFQRWIGSNDIAESIEKSYCIVPEPTVKVS